VSFLLWSFFSGTTVLRSYSGNPGGYGKSGWPGEGGGESENVKRPR
jgi:hypothetical protein